MSESNKKWYVLRAAGGKEKKAKEYLEKEIERRSLQDFVSQVLVPTEKSIRSKMESVSAQSVFSSLVMYLSRQNLPESCSTSSEMKFHICLVS